MKTLALTLAAVMTLVAQALIAQEGHPLSGSWHGQWTNGTQKNNVVLFLRWESNNIVGTINPGPNAVPIKNSSVDATNWAVRLEGEGKDKAGKEVRVVIEGKIDKLGSYNRTLTGTWTQGAVKGELQAIRD